MTASLYDPFANFTPSQRLAAAAHNSRRARIASMGRPDEPVAVYVPPAPPVVKKQWFSIECELPVPLRVTDIQLAVVNYFKISMNDLLSPRRDHKVIRPRQIAMYLAKTMTPRTLPEIGRRFGGRDHTTILHAVRKVEALVMVNADLAQDVELIRSGILA